MLFIDNQSSLDKICTSILQEKIIAIDSEFERRTTYYAIPSIFQIVSDKYKFIIDLLAPLDLTIFKQILLDDQILKILHSSREDLEIFYRLFKILPRNLFDTQIAAKLCEMGNSVSYSNLCKQICMVEIDKKYQKANWLKRPLSPQMLQYAIGDALYLKPIYQSLQEELGKRNLIQKFNEEMQNIVALKNYKLNLEDAWRKVNFANRSVAFTKLMQTIAAFREECASDADLPRRHFLTDEDLVKICNYLPVSERSLNHLNLSNDQFIKSKYKNKLFELCIGLKESI